MNPSGGPRVTTVIPTFNRARMVARAIESALNQNFADIRVCVYDDASEDDTEAIVKGIAARDSRVVYFRHKQRIGSLPNFQFGLERVETPYFSPLADDDVLLPRCYEAHFEQLDRYPDVDFSIGVTLQMDAEGTLYRANALDLPAGIYRAPEGLLMTARRYAPQWTGMLFHRRVLEVAGGLDPRVLVLDLDFQFRAAGLCNCVLFHEPVAVFNTHPGSTSFRLRYPLVWPGWQYLVEKIASDQRIPEAARSEVVPLLNQRIRSLLPKMGLEAIAVGAFDDATAIASILRRDFKDGSRGTMLAALTAMVSRSRALQAAVRSAYVKRGQWRLRALREEQERFASAAKYLQPWGAAID